MRFLACYVPLHSGTMRLLFRNVGRCTSNRGRPRSSVPHPLGGIRLVVGPFNPGERSIMRSQQRSALRPWLVVEQLECRYAPATLVNPFTVTYQDVDGDNVTVKISKPLFQAATINNVFDFKPAGVNGSNTSPQQLRTIDLSILAAGGTSLTLTATHSPVHGGNGFDNLGFLNAGNLDLGSVTIDGDLGRMSAGDANLATAGLVSLQALSMGRYGTTTQAPGGDLNTVLFGKVASIAIRQDVVAAQVQVAGNASS